VDIPDGAKSVAAAIMVQEHAELLRAYRLANNVDKVCCKCIIKAFDDKFLSAQVDPRVWYEKVTLISFLSHLKYCYAFISPIELIYNYECMMQSYDPSHPIEDLFKKMPDGRSYAQAGYQPYGCHQNGRRTILDKTWDHLKVYFTMEHSLYRKQSHVTQASGFHTDIGAHRGGAHRGIQAKMVAGNSEAITMLTSSTASDDGTVSTLLSTNVTLSSHLAEKLAALLAANKTIRLLRAGNRGGRGTSGTPNSTRATIGGSECVRPVTDNNNY
jgi:hypothetical protein